MPLQQGISQEVYCHRYIYDTEVYHTTTSNVFQVVLNITGRGKAQVGRPTFPGNAVQRVRITVDGNIVINDRALGQSGSDFGALYGIFDFNSSFLLEQRSADGINRVDIISSYCVS